MAEYIYKICPTALWIEAEEKGVFSGSGIDLTDGYIHFSTAAQTAQTLALHFTGKSGLILAQIATDGLAITWEESRGGQLFPHLYDDLPMSSVTQSWELAVDEAGLHILPDLS